MDFVLVAVLTALVKKLVDFPRYLRASDWNAVLTQLLAWVGGVLVTIWAAATPWAADLIIGGTALADLNLAAQALAGMSLGSAASIVTDTTKAIDNRTTAQVPDLVPPR